MFMELQQALLKYKEPAQNRNFPDRLSASQKNQILRTKRKNSSARN